MKKNGIALAIILIILVLTLVACSNTTDATDKSDIDDFVVTIHPNNGDPNVKWDISNPIPKFEKEGFEIEGYYLDRDFTIEVVLTSLKITGLNGYIDVYIKWKKKACEHDIVIDDAVPATCTEKGLTEGKHCSKCDEVILAQEIIPALGHDLEEHSAKTPTCTEVGWEAYKTCSRCDYTTYVEIPTTGHDYKAKVTDPTCTGKGYTIYTCHCGDTYVADELPATGHSPLDAVKEKEITPDCTTKGSYDSVVYCSVCNNELSRETIPVDALGHNLIPHDGKSSTCTEIGWEEYETCSRCDHTSYAEIPATGHSLLDAVKENEIAPDCTAKGSYDSVVYCSVCNNELSRETIPVDALGHNLIPHVGKSPTCTEIGWEAYVTCSRCDHTTYVEIPATGHDYSSDCDIFCNVCSYERASYVSHTYDNTCDTNCNECGAIREIEHTYSSDCDIICNVCEYERVSSVNHTYSSDCDIICNVCEHERVSSVNHTYSSNCDTTCNDCGATRTTTTAHSDVNPADNSCDNCGASVSILTFTLSDDGQSYAITGVSANISGDITIPSTYNGKPVTTIGAAAFYGCTSLTSVTFGENSQLTTIGDYAFDSCISLTSIVIADSVTTIGSSAFYYCDSLTSVTFGENSQLTTIESSAFEDCTSLTSITIPNSVTSIGLGSFQRCSGLTSITLPFVGATKDGTKNTHFGYIFRESSFSGNSDCVPPSLKEVIITGGTTIGDQAFYNCTSLRSIVIPDSVTTIGDVAFQDCTSLTDVYYTGDIAGWCGISFVNAYSNPMYYADNLYIDGKLVEDLVIPDSVTAIGSAAFSGCSGLTSVTIPDSVTAIGSSAFSGCTGLTSVTIGGSVTSIGGEAFFGCSGLTSVTIGGSVTSIGDEAFAYCTSLTSIVIPDSVITIGEYAFIGCDSLTSISVDENNPNYKSIDGNLYSKDGKTFIQYAIGKKATSFVILDSVTTIGRYAFDECTSLTSVTFGANSQLTSIGDAAFFYCTSLTRVTFGENSQLISIGTSAFGGCTSLTSVTIPDSVTTIGDCAFAYCDSLTSITIPDSVTTIGDGAFDGCHGLTYNVYDNGKYLGSESNPYLLLVEATSTSITSCEINENCKVIFEYAFYKCTSLTSIVIPDSVTSIGSYAFSGCTSLTSIVIPDSVTTIGNFAFDECTSLTSVTFGANSQLTTIGSSAFGGCRWLKSVTFGENSQLTTIGSYTFADCYSLTSITIPNSVTTIGDYAFDSCDSLTSVTIGDSVTTIERAAFYNCTSLTDVYYTGTKEQWGRISIVDYYNYYLTNATIHYNYVADEN